MSRVESAVCFTKKNLTCIMSMIHMDGVDGSVAMSNFASEQQCDAPDSTTITSGDGSAVFPLGRANLLSHIATLKVLSVEPGYMDACRLVFCERSDIVRNVNCLVTENNSHLLKSAELARNGDELPVQQHWFPAETDVEQISSQGTMIVLYSRDQVLMENAKAGTDAEEVDAAWYIVGVFALEEAGIQPPMKPHMMVRNGQQPGGSGHMEEDVSVWEHATSYWGEPNAPLGAPRGTPRVV